MINNLITDIMKTIPTPSMFKGFKVGSTPQVRKNRFTGEEATLTPKETMIYDVIFIAEYFASLYEDQYSKEAQDLYEFVRCGCSWFKQYNARIYMILLD